MVAIGAGWRLRPCRAEESAKSQLPSMNWSGQNRLAG